MSNNVVSIKSGKPVVNINTMMLKISTSNGHQGRVTNGRMTWEELCNRLSKTAWDSLSMERYLALTIAQQDKRKNQGYFVGGQFKGGVRKIGAINERSLLTFDVDNCSPAVLADLQLGMGWLGDYEYFVYSTRKHTPEKPRVRIVVPVAGAVPVSQYAPLTRIMAEKIDRSMVAVDPVSFRPAQIMYWPNTCHGSEFVSFRNEGALLDGDTVLREFGDWQDYSKLPRSPREKSLRQAGEKVTDPLTKRGIVGAFCRAYSISAAIEKFLPDVYEPGDQNADGTQRFSFLAGSTRNGAVVYDEDKHLYSHHGTDPCADKLVNAWDMVRLHKFGEQDKPDENGQENENPTTAKSYKELVEFLADDKAIQDELRDEQTDFDAIFGDGEDPPEDTAKVDRKAVARDAEPDPEEQAEEEHAAELDEGGEQVVVPPQITTADDPEWRERLDTNDKGVIKSTLHNIILILENDPRFKGAFGFNEFIMQAVLTKRVRSKQFRHDTGKPLNIENGDPVSDFHAACIRAILEAPRGEGKSGYGLRVTDRDLRDALSRISNDHKFHPVQSYLKACRWDGTARLDDFLHTYTGATSNEYTRQVGRLAMIAAVQRAFEPGCKFDNVVILEGGQGLGKSTFIALLAGPTRFGELHGDLSDKRNVVEQISGKWLLEIPELSQFHRTEIEVVKAMFSATHDKARLAYARGTGQDYARQCAFWGTTNKSVYLKDDENRRFWPVAISGKIDLAGIARDRDQLWAEAYQQFLFMRRKTNTPNLPLYLTGEADSAQRAITNDRSEGRGEDTMAGMIRAWLDEPVPAPAAVCGFRGDREELETVSSEPKVQRNSVCVKDILFYVFGKADKDVDVKMSMSIAKVLSETKKWNQKPGGPAYVNKALGYQRVWRRNVITKELVRDTTP